MCRAYNLRILITYVLALIVFLPPCWPYFHKIKCDDPCSVTNMITFFYYSFIQHVNERLPSVYPRQVPSVWLYLRPLNRTDFRLIQKLKSTTLKAYLIKSFGSLSPTLNSSHEPNWFRVNYFFFSSSQALFRLQLSWWRISESNRWPPACKAGALASWANPPFKYSRPCLPSSLQQSSRS
jgi:hypothetical protein